ncbi:MAG TPA: hypothetical protein VNY25_00955 [Steroidobacteraceae bacterium]|jgi:hypothetical protein|nr:hypothetical protein [Steroidobacteraceae bacterium]
MDQDSGMLGGMGDVAKTSQMQIRVSGQEKAAIRRAAKRAGLPMSVYVLRRVLSVPADEFSACIKACVSSAPAYALAELNTLLSGFTAGELSEAVAAPPALALPPFLANYIAAMVEYACAQRGVAVPTWTKAIAPLTEPAFGSELLGLRLYLLTHSPAPFRRRNIFIDASVGARV